MQREHLWAKLTFWTITRTKLHLGTESRSNKRYMYFSLQLWRMSWAICVHHNLSIAYDLWHMICKLCYLILLSLSYYFMLIWVWDYRYKSNNVIHWSRAVRTECCSRRAEVDANVRWPVGKEGSERCSWHWWSANWQGIMAQLVTTNIKHALRNLWELGTSYQVQF